MLEPDAGFSIKHDRTPTPTPDSSPATTPAQVSTTPAPESSAPLPPTTLEPMPRPIFADLVKSLSPDTTATTSAPTTSVPESAPATASTVPAAGVSVTNTSPTQPNIQTIQTSDPNFVVTKNLDADSVFATAAPTASFSDLTKKAPVTPPPADEPKKPAIEISNPFASQSLFEETPKPNTPSVAFNDPAGAPDAPRLGTDPGTKKGVSKEDLQRIKEKLNSPELKAAAKSAKDNPMRALLIVSAAIIVILIIAIALVS